PEEDFADSEAVQDSLNNANFELYISPTRPDDPVEKAFNAVNDAENAEDMQEALQNEDLGLNVGEYNQLSDDEKAEVAETVLDNRPDDRSEEHTSELQSRFDLVCRLLLEKKKKYV